MPRPTLVTAIHSPEINSRLPLFDGFPYLATRIVPGALHINVLPHGWGREQLLTLLEQQIAANQFEAALVLSSDEAHYRWPRDTRVVVASAPRSTVVLTCGLFTPVAFEGETLGDRPQHLERYCQRVSPGGMLLGDLRKGGRAATPDEIARLRGRGPAGVPLGLSRCQRCGDWCGTCVDPSPHLANWMVQAHCRCDNVTRCARCLEPFRERRVSGNEYRESDGQVWHWPGFMALDHRCPLVEASDDLPTA